MNYLSTTKNLHHIESELRTLQFEMLQKRKERKFDELEDLERLVDDLHYRFLNLKRKAKAES
jgi:hypothetical protein